MEMSLSWMRRILGDIKIGRIALPEDISIGSATSR
jgi:hypothetical protein